MQTLGFVMLTRDSALFVGRVLEQAHSYADDIAVWVDVKSVDDTLDVCRGLADRVKTITTAGYIEPHLREMHDAMKTDWIVRIDDDECFGADFWRRKALLTALPFDAIGFGRYNLVGDERHYAAAHGYCPDWQVRMTRRGKAGFTGRIHSHAKLADGRYPLFYPGLHIFHRKELVRTKAELDAMAERYAALMGRAPAPYGMMRGEVRECEEEIG